MNALITKSTTASLLVPFCFLSCISYFFNNVALAASLGIPASLGQWLDIPILSIARIIFMTWSLGAIIEILSGEHRVPVFSSFKQNVKKYWWISALALSLPMAVHFLVFIASQSLLPMPLLVAGLTVPVAYGTACYFIKIKYAPLLRKQFKEPKFSFSLLGEGVLITVVCLGLAMLATGGALPPFLAPIPELLLSLAFWLSFALFSIRVFQENPVITQHFSSSKILILVNLPAGGIAIETIYSLLLRLYPPFFCVLRALTPATYRIIEYNCALWLGHAYQKGALVAISCFTSNCAEAYKIAKEFRKNGSTVVMGGPHVSFFPDEALAFCDSIVVGFAESVWQDVLKDFENGCLQSVYQGNCSQEGHALTQDFLLHAPCEITEQFLQANRGCKFNCYFCANPALTGKLSQQKSLDDIMALIKKVTLRKKSFKLLDNNFYADPAYAKDFFRALKPLKITWGGSASIDIAQDEEALQLLKESGCASILIGYEIDPGSLEQDRGGKFNQAQNYLALTRKIQKAGIQIKGHFIFGFPQDSWRSLARLWWFCFRLAPSITAVSFLTPLPGARFFDDAARQGKIFNLNWRNYHLSSQVCDHPVLRRPWILQHAFILIVVFFFLTTSRVGRVLLLGAICVAMLSGIRR